MTTVKIGGNEYPAYITGKMKDESWGDRPSKTINVAMAYGQAASLFVDGASWSIVTDDLDENDQPIRVEYDNSDYSMAGPITDKRDGSVAVKMGKPSELEESLALIDILMGEEA